MGGGGGFYRVGGGLANLYKIFFPLSFFLFFLSKNYLPPPSLFSSSACIATNQRKNIHTVFCAQEAISLVWWPCAHFSQVYPHTRLVVCILFLPLSPYFPQWGTLFFSLVVKFLFFSFSPVSFSLSLFVSCSPLSLSLSLYMLLTL